MEIAKGIQSDEYLHLNLDDNNSSDWKRAITMLKNRITERYIEPIDKLIELENDLSPLNKKYGFTILAIDCMVLETIQAFYEGLENTKGQSEDMFINFLTQRESLRSYFDGNLAKTFYRNYRCGILHQTETNSKNKIWSVGEMLIKRNDYLIINRNEFHNNIKIEFEYYLNSLSNNTNIELRNNFRKKMNFICGK